MSKHCNEPKHNTVPGDLLVRLVTPLQDHECSEDSKKPARVSRTLGRSQQLGVEASESQ